VRERLRLIPPGAGHSRAPFPARFSDAYPTTTKFYEMIYCDCVWFE
jgi:hypothetical protein